MSIASVGIAANGTLSANGDGTITYTPNAGFTGDDGFTYTVSDGSLSASASVAVTVLAGGQTGGVVLADFGASAAANSFGLPGWDTVIKDKYTNYVALGPGGTTITGGSNKSYNYQGVRGAEARSFIDGERIVVHWFNASDAPITFTPNLSFDDPDRITSGATGTWHAMSPVTVPAGGSATTELLIDAAKAGSYALVNVNCNHSNNQQLICDKILLEPESQLFDG